MNSPFLNNFSRIFKANFPFLIPALLFWTFGTSWLLIDGKANVHLWFDVHHYPPFDIFFKYVTHMGDGLLLLAVIVLLFILKQKDKAWPLLVGYLSSTTLVQIVKNFLPQNSRPYIYFYHRELYRIQGVDLMADGSFPSGHSSIAFCLYFMLATMVKPWWQKTLLGLVAVSVCISRMYLNQHFFSDVIVGGMIGWLLMSIVLCLMAKSE